MINISRAEGKVITYNYVTCPLRWASLPITLGNFAHPYGQSCPTQWADSDKAFRKLLIKPSVKRCGYALTKKTTRLRDKYKKNRLTPFGISLSCSLAYYFYSSPLSSSSVFSGISSNGNCLLIAALNEMMVSLRDKPNGCNLSWMISNKWWLLLA